MADGDVTMALVDRVRLAYGPEADKALADAEIIIALDMAQYDLLWRLPEAAVPEHTVVSEDAMTASTIGLPVDFWRERLVQIGAHTAAPWPVTQLDAVGEGAEEDPLYYTWHDGAEVKMLVNVDDPASVLNYSLWYLALPPTLSSIVDPTIPTRFLELLVLWATSYLQETYMHLGEAVNTFGAYMQSVGIIQQRYFIGTREERGPGGGGSWRAS